MGYSYWICDTLTGAKKVPVRPSDGSWANALNAISQGSHTFLLDDETNALLPWDSLTQDWANTLVVDWNDEKGDDGQIVYAGLMLAPTVDHDTATMTIEHSTLRQIFTRRTTLGANGYGGVDGGRDEILNKTLASIAVRIVQDGCVGPTAGYPLPIRFPALVTGPHSRTYRDWNFPVVHDEITGVTNVIGGPDVAFPAHWTFAGQLEWDMLAGTLTGPLLEWDLTVPERGLTEVKTAFDGRMRSTSSYVTGNGSEIKMLVKVARASTIVGPALDSLEELGDVVDETVLQSHADGNQATFGKRTEQWSASMQADGVPGLSSLVLGQPIRVKTRQLGPVAAGWHDLRLIGFSGDATTRTIKLSFQPGGS